MTHTTKSISVTIGMAKGCVSYSLSESIDVTPGPDEKPDEADSRVGDLIETTRQKLESKVDFWLADVSEACAQQGQANPGSNTRSGGVSRQNNNAPLTDGQLAYLQDLVKQTRTDPETLCERFGAYSLESLTRAQASEVITELDELRDEKRNGRKSRRSNRE